jgi:hypothetical protein
VTGTAGRPVRLPAPCRQTEQSIDRDSRASGGLRQGADEDGMSGMPSTPGARQESTRGKSRLPACD